MHAAAAIGHGWPEVPAAVLILVVNATGEKTPLPPELREHILARDPGVETGATP